MLDIQLTNWAVDIIDSVTVSSRTRQYRAHVLDQIFKILSTDLMKGTCHILFEQEILSHRYNSRRWKYWFALVQDVIYQ